MKGLIIAAGKGSRLRKISADRPKPLTPVMGVPLIERIIRTALDGGIDKLYVVTGYMADTLEKFLEQLEKRLNTDITIIRNNDWHEENGVSVLKARQKITEPFFLMMGDHLFDSRTIKALGEKKLKENEVILAVDTDLESPFTDMDDATKVLCENGCILDIGKEIEKFNAIDTGLFLCSPALFDALEHSIRQGSGTALTAALRMMAEKGQVKCCDIKGPWIDVDDEAAYERAEKMLLSSVCGKPGDGPVSRWVNRPLSSRLSCFLVRYDITPSQISVFSFLMSVVAAVMMGVPGREFLAAGGILAQAASVIDGCDGEVARLKYLSSEYGGWLDAVLDRYADGFVLAGLTFNAFLSSAMPYWVLFAGFMAITGSFVLSYTADKYDRLMKERIQKRTIRIGRDIRVFIVFSGAVLNMAFAALILMAVIMNAATIHRIIICRK